MLTYAECFYLEDVGIGHWIVRHSISDEFAGTITRNPSGFLLKDVDAAKVGLFGSKDDAIRELYATA